MHSIDPHIFRAYDIRGKFPEQVSEESFEHIAAAFALVLKRRYGTPHPTVVVGRDARTHSPLLEAAVIRGLIASGCSVRTIGQTPSPVNYFTICTHHFDGGIQVTASHNPAEDNGLKLQIRDAESFSGEELQTIRMMAEKKERETGEGTVTPLDANQEYETTLTKMFGECGKGLKIAVDCGNGVTGPLNTKILRGVGCEVTELFTEPDGTFPNHQPDPSRHTTLNDLQKTVTEHHLDLGIAFDGDGDRLGIVDERGVIRSPDEVLLLLAKDVLSRHPGTTVITTVSMSSILETEIAKLGGKSAMCKVGHSFVEHAMREHHSLLGGEQSGHFFCGEDAYGYDDALLAALHVIRIVKEGGTPISVLLSAFPKTFSAHELRPHCNDHEKTRVAQSITAHFAKSYPVNTLDGVRIDFGEGAWAGIRQSNTAPCLSICMEARSEKKLKEVEMIVLGYVKGYREIEFEK